MADKEIIDNDIQELIGIYRKLGTIEKKAILKQAEQTSKWCIREKAISGEEPLIIYGTKSCPDCQKCLKQMNELQVQYEFRDIMKNLQFLKHFIGLRDDSISFKSVKTQGKLGIPCIYISQDWQIFDWEDLINEKNPLEINV